MQRFPVPALALGALLVGGCSDAAGGDAVLDIEALPALTYSEVARIGSTDDPVLGFSQIGGVRVGPDGSVYVLETQAKEVRVYDASGTLVRTIGQPGQGPGEFDRPSAFGLLHDTVWVEDSRHRRISWFGPDGSVLFETPTTGSLTVLDTPEARITLLPGAPNPDGTLSSTLSYSLARGAEMSDSVEVPIVRFDRRGEVFDTVGMQRVMGAPARFVQVPGALFAPRANLLTSPITDGDTMRIVWETVAESERGTLVVTRMRGPGDTIARARFTYAALPTALYIDSLVASYSDPFVQRGIDRRTMEDAVRAALIDAPAVHPPISSHLTGRDGSLWLERSSQTAEDVPAGMAAWIVLAPDGEVRGELLLPGSMSPSWVDGNTAWVVDRDALEVPWLVRIEIGG